MTMKNALALAAALLLCSCGRDPGRPAGAGQTGYRAPDGSFAAHLPSDWRVDGRRVESPGATFFGPPGGPAPYSQRIGVYFHAASNPAAEARAFLAARGSPGLEPGEADSTDITADIHGGRRVRLTVKTTVALAPGGFFSLQRVWPEGSQPDPALDEFVRSFQVGSTNLIR